MCPNMEGVQQERIGVCVCAWVGVKVKINLNWSIFEQFNVQNDVR